MKALFWSPVPFARQATEAAVASVEGVELRVVVELDDCLREVGSADLLILGDAPAPVARQVLDAVSAPDSRTRALHFISAGRDGFEQAGIPDDLVVTGQDGAAAPTVAEHAVALLLAVLRQTIAISRNTAERTWDRSTAQRLRSLEGQRVLIVGLGNIGREVATRVRAFGAHTVGLQRTARADDSADELGLISELDAHLAAADVVVLTVALAEETAGMIGAARLALMKPTAVVVNVSRGGLVDHDALAATLADGKLGGAALDVTDPEPFPAEHPLWGAPNVILSPHVAGGGSPATMARIGKRVAERVRELARLSDVPA